MDNLVSLPLTRGARSRYASHTDRVTVGPRDDFSSTWLCRNPETFRAPVLSAGRVLRHARQSHHCPLTGREAHRDAGLSLTVVGFHRERRAAAQINNLREAAGITKISSSVSDSEGLMRNTCSCSPFSRTTAFSRWFSIS